MQEKPLSYVTLGAPQLLRLLRSAVGSRSYQLNYKHTAAQLATCVRHAQCGPCRTQNPETRRPEDLDLPWFRPLNCAVTGKETQSNLRSREPENHATGELDNQKRYILCIVREVK